jgi:hypothetical protein
MTRALSILRALPGFRQHGDSFFVVCPVHKEKTGSLRVTQKNGKLLLCCHSCHAPTKAILDALGLSWGDLFEGRGLSRDDYRKALEAAEKRKNEALKRELELNSMLQQLRFRDWQIRTATKWSQLQSAYDGYSALEWRLQELVRGR